MAYFWLSDKQSLQQIALLTNTFIQVLMYFYYFLCTIGRGPNWKRLITNAQIAQFAFRSAQFPDVLLLTLAGSVFLADILSMHAPFEITTSSPLI